MDCLSDVLNRIRFRGTIYCVTEFTAPWGLRMPGYEGHVGFLMMLRGGCLVTLPETNQSFTPASGELMLLPRGAICVIQDQASSAVTPIVEVNNGQPPNRGQLFRFGGGGALTSLLMGCFEFDMRVKNPLVEGLPDVIYLKGEHLQSEPWLDTTLRFLAAETENGRQGTNLLVSRLTDMVFVQVIRAYISQIKNCSEAPNWLRALGDPEIGAALNLIHEQPSAPWTVASLASAVGMSRTSFATKFSSLVTNSPMDYLTSWRMQGAVSLMEQGEDNLSQIANAVGYTSEAAFAKAFKREVGQAPGGFRRSLDSSSRMMVNV
ncbi:MAG: AraC family transcriptional regulator [Leptolyngbya sp.]|nr:AraC family transcriptional regulator [Candidatus Melainabacteria bacterium]